jgi:hypothetical protein
MALFFIKLANVKFKLGEKVNLNVYNFKKVILLIYNLNYKCYKLFKPFTCNEFIYYLS